MIDTEISSPLQLPQQPPHIHLPANDAAQLADRHAFLLHGVAVADGHLVVGEGIVVHGDAVGRTDGILPAVALADAVLVVVLAVVVQLQRVDDGARFLRQAVLS
jgi:hypothetical protein